MKKNIPRILIPEYSQKQISKNDELSQLSSKLLIDNYPYYYIETILSGSGFYYKNIGDIEDCVIL